MRALLAPAPRILSTEAAPLSSSSVMGYLIDNRGAIGVSIGLFGAGIAGVKYIVGAETRPLIIEIRAIEKKFNDKFAVLNEMFAAMDKEFNEKLAAMDKKMDMYIEHTKRIDERYAKFGED
jgi:hypothetical protein